LSTFEIPRTVEISRLPHPGDSLEFKPLLPASALGASNPIPQDEDTTLKTGSIPLKTEKIQEQGTSVKYMVRAGLPIH
jgi:hypothetical protein